MSKLKKMFIRLFLWKNFLFEPIAPPPKLLDACVGVAAEPLLCLLTTNCCADVFIILSIALHGCAAC
jgi:hypothetical protein